jgi:hypothetical protein
VEWAVEEGADYIIGETFDSYGEAQIALKTILDHVKGELNILKASTLIHCVHNC